MTDIKTLKALAEAATPGPWTVSEEHESASFQGYVAGDADGWIAIFGTTNKDADNADYVAAANPAAVLELITEIEYLQMELSGVERAKQDLAEVLDCANEPRWKWLYCNASSLKAENESLRKSLLEASEEVAAWGAYASEYFQEKHDLAGCVARIHDTAMSKESSHG